MKHLLAALLLTLALSSHAQEGARDGNWWKKLPSQETKWGYLVGVFDGMLIGHRLSRWGLEASDKTSDCVPHVSASFREHIQQYFKNLDSQKLATDLDAFYNEPKNRSIKLTDSIWIIANQQSGKPKAELDAMIQDYRGR